MGYEEKGHKCVEVEMVEEPQHCFSLSIFKLFQLDDFNYRVQQFDLKMHYLFYHLW